MKMNRYIPFELVLCIFLIGGAFSFSEALAQQVTPPFEIQVDVDSLNVRDDPPWFSWRTIFTFNYYVNPPIDVLPRGQRANVFDTRLVGTGKLWLRIKYSKEGQQKTGWVYAGTKQNIVNVKIITGGQSSSTSRKSSIETLPERSQFDLVSIFVGSALADTAANRSNEASTKQVDPDLRAPPVKVIVVLLLYVVVFVGSLLATHKVTSNGFLSFFVGLGVLLILGYITPDIFSSSLGRSLLGLFQ